MPHPQKTGNLRWNQTLNVKDIEPFCNTFQGLFYNLPVGSTEEDCFSLFVDSPFCEKVDEETNKCAAVS
jgi:hypothetical protein